MLTNPIWLISRSHQDQGLIACVTSPEKGNENGLADVHGVMFLPSFPTAV
jgi:hypothetical protein